MGSTLFKQFIRKALVKQGPPGPPPRQGLQWKPQTHRWIRPRGGETGPVQDEHVEEVQNPYTEHAMEFVGQVFEDADVAGGVEEGEYANQAELAERLSGFAQDEVTNTRNDDPDPAYFEQIFGFEPTSENIDLFREAIDIEAKDRAEHSWKAYSGQDTPQAGETAPDDYTSDMGEIAYENIQGDIEMEGLEGPESFGNAKDYAEYLASSSLQTIFEIRGDSGGEEEDYFLDNVGFTDTDENLDAYENALSIQAKEIADNPDFAELYGTGTDEDGGTNEWSENAKDLVDDIVGDLEIPTDMSASDIQEVISDGLGDFQERAEEHGIDMENDEEVDAFSSAVESYVKSKSESIATQNTPQAGGFGTPDEEYDERTGLNAERAGDQLADKADQIKSLFADRATDALINGEVQPDGDVASDLIDHIFLGGQYDLLSDVGIEEQDSDEFSEQYADIMNDATASFMNEPGTKEFLATLTGGGEDEDDW